MKSRWMGLALLAAGAVTAAADDDRCPPMRDGDTVAADVFNERFRRTEEVLEGMVSASDLVGVWGATFMVPMAVGDPPPGFQLDSSGLFNSFWTTITFRNDGDGTFSYQLGAHHMNPFEVQGSPELNAESGKYTARSNILFYDPDGPQLSRSCSMFRLTPSKVEVVQDINSMRILLEKQDRPPAVPEGLSAMIRGGSVTLAWTDRSANETGFKILRKDQLGREYAVIATVAADATQHVDAPPGPGTYWYRVVATNDHGDSLGSNVAKATVAGP